MPLLRHRYGKGHVRVMRVFRDGQHNEVRELTVRCMLDGDFSGAYLGGDNRQVVATDTIKNICYIVAGENLRASSEDYARALARRFLERYPHVVTVTVATDETRWDRLSVKDAPHPHAFTLNANGFATVALTASRESEMLRSGVKDFTFMKTTEAGWAEFWEDEYTTLPDTTDRIVATAMEASWLWRSDPPDFPTANARILQTALTEFATTYSKGVQDSLYRMGEAVLAAVPEVAEISMACPNKHYLGFDLSRFGGSTTNQVFVSTDEPHGQIECTVGREPV